MFCSIEDAWGDNFIDYKPEMVENNKPEKFENIEYNTNKKYIQDNDYNKYIELKEKFENNENKENKENKEIKSDICQAVETHILNCQYCKNKYKNNNYNIDKYILNNKESINIFLIGILIICFFHFFRNF
jgi:Fe2+ transport system protein B